MSRPMVLPACRAPRELADDFGPSDALEAIVESLDVIHVAPDVRPGRERHGGLAWCLVALPLELVDWLCAWGAELAEVEDDDPDGLDEDPPEDDDPVEDEELAASTSPGIIALAGSR